MQYLVIKCEELNDQYECDANRVPICITEDISKYGFGYEIWKIEKNGKLTLHKEYEESTESGMALYKWEDESDLDEKILPPPTVVERYANKTRDDFTEAFFRELKAKVNFEDSVKDIYTDVRQCGSHGETIDGQWVVFGEYNDNQYSLGY